MKDNEKYIKSTKHGRLYIETKDFFKIKKVKEIIAKLLNSNIIKNIENGKRRKR